MLDDEPLIIKELIKNTRAGGAAAQMTLGQFSGHGEGNDRINLSTLHSAKGREWPLVIMMAMDYGEIPWRNVTPKEVLQDRRLFYVGFTRAKLELHIVFTNGQESPFVEEVQNRLLMG